MHSQPTALASASSAWPKVGPFVRQHERALEGQQVGVDDGFERERVDHPIDAGP
jgi:hypothetical protein